MEIENQDVPQDEYSIPQTNDAPIPGWLKWMYVVVPIWGFIIFALYWNGSSGWLDRGYWHQLQQASNTVYPFNSHSPHNENKSQDAELKNQSSSK